MEFRDGVLIITDSISVNATVVDWAVQHYSVGLKDLRIVTQASLLEGNLYFKSSSLSAIVSISEKPGFHNQLWLIELVKVLKPGGSLFLQEASFFDGNKEIALRDSRSTLERNLLFAGFSSMEISECLDHSAEIGSSPQDFQLIAIEAKRPWVTDTSFTEKQHTQNEENSEVAVVSTVQPEMDDVDDLIEEVTLLAAEDSKKIEFPLDNSFLLRERIRERNRLYQRRRRARMTEEQKERERERRRQYMQSRRVQPISYEVPLPLPISYERPVEFEQSPQCSQQLREVQGVEIENNQVIG